MWSIMAETLLLPLMTGLALISTGREPLLAFENTRLCFAESPGVMGLQ